MSVLSDKTIRKMIKELVPKGNVASAEYCSYEFTAALMMRGGSHKAVKITGSGVVIKPAQLVWIRASEEISMPINMVGLWIQTQTLSRDGLLLLNTTLIEPGYEGPLSAVLVNFGKKDVVIGPETKIAKVIFLPLDIDCTKPVGKSDSGKYDTKLMNRAANAPKTFLHLGSLLPDIEKTANAKLAEIDEEIMERVTDILKERIPSIEKDLQGGIKSTLIKWGGTVCAGLIIGCGLVWLMISSYLPRLSEYSKFDLLARKAATTQQAEIITDLNTQIKNLAIEVNSLKKQVQGDSTNIKAVSDSNNTDTKQ